MKTKTTTITAAEAATNTNIKNQEEKVMNKKNYELKKFTDEESFHYGDRLEETYTERARIIKGFYENYVLGAVKETEQYREYAEQGFSDKIDRVVEIADVIMDYLTEFVVTGRGWQSLITNLTDCNGAVIEGVGIFNIVSDAVSMATFAIDGNYKKIRVNKSYFRLYKHVSEEYVKTGEYDEKTGEIEVYIPENYEFESAEKWLREHDAGDLYEMAVELMEERKELAEKKQEIISSVESWYEGCYDAIYDLTKSVKNTNKYSRNRDTMEARKLERYWKLMGYSRGDGDEREVDFDTIRDAVIDYLREQPLEYFEDIDDPFNEDSMLDIIDDAYNYADFELPERPDRKEEWMEFVRTCPADWFDYADDPEQERENLIDMYEDWDDVVFCDFDYAVSGEYSDPYTTMRDDA